MNTCNVTVVIPTYCRANQLLKTIEKILSCNPYPDEIIVHIDGDDRETEEVLLSSSLTAVSIVCSSEHVGPGGGRNRAIAQAKNSLVASFDDDSYPIDTDYFQRLLILFQLFPDAAVIGASIYHLDESVAADSFSAAWAAEFIGCGCAYRKKVFLQMQGYVPLPVAYGMEEVDLALRLHHAGWSILSSNWLRVFHDTRLEHHAKPHINAASISNQLLLAYLRYPILFWGLGVIQCLSRILWLIRHGRVAGIVKGLCITPALIQQHHDYRQIVSAKSLLSFLHLRRNTTSVNLQNYLLN